jgi:hypothetical protein
LFLVFLREGTRGSDGAEWSKHSKCYVKLSLMEQIEVLAATKLLVFTNQMRASAEGFVYLCLTLSLPCCAAVRAYKSICKASWSRPDRLLPQPPSLQTRFNSSSHRASGFGPRGLSTGTVMRAPCAIPLAGRHFWTFALSLDAKRS